MVAANAASRVAATPSPPALVTNATGVSAGQDLLGARLTATTPATANHAEDCRSKAGKHSIAPS